MFGKSRWHRPNNCLAATNTLKITTRLNLSFTLKYHIKFPNQFVNSSPLRIMKITAVLTVFLCFASLLVNRVNGGYVILQVLLNNGNSHYCIDRWNNCCTSTEWDLISSRVYAMSQNQRDLEGSNTTIQTDDDTFVEVNNSTQVDGINRDLATYPRYCANSCAGYTTGRCMALNCKGYRQRRTTAESKSSALRPKRDLFYSTSCENQKSEMNNLLTNIRNEVGPRCQSLLNAPRKMTCFNTDRC